MRVHDHSSHTQVGRLRQCDGVHRVDVLRGVTGELEKGYKQKPWVNKPLSPANLGVTYARMSSGQAAAAPQMIAPQIGSRVFGRNRPQTPGQF